MELNQEVFVSTIDELSEAIVIYDKDDNFVACNRANHELYPQLSPLYKQGSNLKDILAHAYAQGQWKSEYESAEKFVEERIKQHWVPFHETEQHLADGRWLLVRNKRLESGLFIGMRTDITELKQREMELEEAMRIAESAERAKSEFLANMSHEIRTPMNGVMGMAELLSTTELDAKQAMFTDVILKSGASLLTIINDILDFSKIDAGQMELDPAPFHLAEAIEDVATL
ncbi:MAG: histidine kinase dimerization/phospho-acceptor domain-containing protein, partial [Pseudomonadota bacterium]